MIDLIDIYKVIWDNLNGLSCNLYDYVPYGLLDFPYAYVGGLYTKDDSTKDTDGISCELYVNVISAYRGRKEILELMNEIDELMSRDMSTNQYSIFVRRGRHAVSQEKDEVGWGKNDSNAFYHAVLIYDIYIKNKQ